MDQDDKDQCICESIHFVDRLQKMMKTMNYFSMVFHILLRRNEVFLVVHKQDQSLSRKNSGTPVEPICEQIDIQDI